MLEVKNKYKAEIERNENEIKILESGHSKLWLQCMSYRSTTFIDIPKLLYWITADRTVFRKPVSFLYDLDLVNYKIDYPGSNLPIVSVIFDRYRQLTGKVILKLTKN